MNTHTDHAMTNTSLAAAPCPMGSPQAPEFTLEQEAIVTNIYSTAVTGEAVASRDGATYWIASGYANGIPFLAETDCKDDALAAACVLVYERHAVRKMRARRLKI